MARPNKTGLEYFPMDVDFFEDDKIQLIEGEFGGKGSLIAIRLLCKIYKENGYFYQWGEDQCLLFAKGAGLGQSLVQEVVLRLVKRSFFDEGVFNRLQILTSRGIQNRYLTVVKRSKIKRDEMRKDIDLLKSSEETEKNSEELNESSEESTQRKAKESKEKKRRGKDISGDKSPPLSFKNFSEDDFVNDIRECGKGYSRETLNSFFSYWREKSPGGKMKFQLEKTWETNLRLKTWQAREIEWNKNLKKETNESNTQKFRDQEGQAIIAARGNRSATGS